MWLLTNFTDIYPSDAKNSSGEYYYVEDRIICDERPFADYERIVNTTGIEQLTQIREEKRAEGKGLGNC